MASAESEKTLAQYHARYNRHLYGKGRIIWTDDMLIFVHTHIDLLRDWEFAKKYHTTIKAVQHVREKLKLVVKMLYHTAGLKNAEAELCVACYRHYGVSHLRALAK